MSEQILNALKTLDPNNPDQWTNDGLPKVDALGVQGIKRSDITQVAPHFTRENPVLELPQEDSIVVDGEKGAEDSEPSAPTITEDESYTEEEEAAVAAATAAEAAALEAVSEHTIDTVLKEDKEFENFKKEKSKLEVARQEAQERVTEAENKLVAAQRSLDAARKELDKAENALVLVSKERTTQHDIRDFIRQQQKIRLEKAQRHNAFMKQGLDLNRLGPSALDKAFARKNNRGTTRPIRPAVIPPKV